MQNEYQELVELYDKKRRRNCRFLYLHNRPLTNFLVFNIPIQTKLSKLAEFFSRYGKIDKISNGPSYMNEAAVFVKFNSPADARRAREDSTERRMVLHNRILNMIPFNIDAERDNWPKTGNINVDDDLRFHMLNDDCLIQIFLHLPILDRIRLERVCKRWRTLSWASWIHVKKLDLLLSTWGYLDQLNTDAISPEMLRSVLRRCGSHLKEIHLLDGLDLTYCDSLLDVAEFCPNVQIINASAIRVSTKSIEMLRSKCKDIRSLSLTEVDNTCDLELTELFKRSTKLTHFCGYLGLRGDCLQHLPHDTIRQIHLTVCNDSVFDYLAQALPNLDNLSRLSLRGSGDWREIVLPIAVMQAVSIHCKRLKRFDLIKLFGLKHCAELITDLSNLEHLRLKGDIDNKFLITLSGKCKKLTHLDISSSSMTWAGIAALALLPKLSKLLISQAASFRRKGVNRWKDKYEDLRIQNVSCTSASFPSLKLLECRCCHPLKPMELLCCINSSPLLELVNLVYYWLSDIDTIEWIMAEALARNSKVEFKVSIADD